MTFAKVDVTVSPTRLRGARELFGRERELEWLDQTWNRGRAKVVTIVAWGGVGKTALINEWRNRLLLCDHTIDCVFDWSFQSQGVRDKVATSADNFLREALYFFGDPGCADGATSSIDKGKRLAELVGSRRTLLLLDGLEPLQVPPQAKGSGRELREESIAVLLKCLAASSRGMCIVTTRDPISELEGFESTSAPRWELDHLSEKAGSDLLKGLLERGRGGQHVASTEAERVEISKAMRGHALTLQVLGSYIRRALGDIHRWQEIDFERADEEHGGHAFRVLATYVRHLEGADVLGKQQLAVLRLLGLFDRPADPGCLAALMQRPAIGGLTESLIGLDAEGWSLLVSSLEEMMLVSRSLYAPVQVLGYDEEHVQLASRRVPGNDWAMEWGLGYPKAWPSPEFGADAFTVDAHPLVREFFSRELRHANKSAWRKAHQRLYVHLKASVPYWPEKAVGLEPLRHAIFHGCSAGRAQEACDQIYYERILRGQSLYSWSKLGAYSADLATLASFFEKPWSRPSGKLTANDRSWVLSRAANCLRALGRLREAVDTMNLSQNLAIDLQTWTYAINNGELLTDLYLALGRLPAAIDAATTTVAHAEQANDDDDRILALAVLADARHQTGDMSGALELFKKAEAIRARLLPRYPKLESVQGYRYVDLLLSSAERTAWRAILGGPTDGTTAFRQCWRIKHERCVMYANLAPAVGVLGRALLCLAEGRAHLYGSRFHPPADELGLKYLSFDEARQYLTASVDGLRSAGIRDYFARSLIERAVLHHHDLQSDRSHACLDEAWAIAERGPMPLYQADIELTRARLFRDRTALKCARDLITRHGYGRRLPELEDAEATARSWPTQVAVTSVAPAWEHHRRPDIAILIALPEEFRTLAEEYASQWTTKPNASYIGDDFMFNGPNGYRCVATIMPRMGPVVASQVSQRLLTWRPALIVNVGIAGAFVDGLCIGDVIVPRQVCAYDETAKAKGKVRTAIRWQRRGSDYRPSPALVAEAAQLEFVSASQYTEWANAGKEAVVNLQTGSDSAGILTLLDAGLLRNKPIVNTNHLASGSFVVASKPFAEFIRDANADIHAGEMEAAGMLTAAEYWREHVETLVVRGISDHVGADKAEIDRIGSGALRRLAMNNAWRFVTMLMKLEKLPRVGE